MSNYSKLTKAQLIEMIDELELRTVEGRIEQIRNEISWLVHDLGQAVQWVYDAGVGARHLLQPVLTTFQKRIGG
jgi:hypothetical protein